MLRTLYKTDLSRVYEIEKSVQVSPWTEDTFKLCLQAGYVGWVIEVAKEVSGFVLISLTEDECHILNLSVARNHQRAGYGKRLIEQVFEYVKQKNIAIVYLEVRQSNTRAIALYRKMKFQVVGQRKDYYPTEAGREDALVFAISMRGP